MFYVLAAFLALYFAAMGLFRLAEWLKNASKISRTRRGRKRVSIMTFADLIVILIVAVLLVLAVLATKKHFGGKGGCCGCSGGCAGCSGSCSASPAAGHTPTPKDAKTFSVQGMQCDNCRRAVEQALIAVPGVTMANVDRQSGRASVTTNGTVTDAQLAGAVKAAGYSAEL